MRQGIAAFGSIHQVPSDLPMITPWKAGGVRLLCALTIRSPSLTEWNTMDLFNYRDGELCCEDVPVADIAGQIGTPVYIYSANTLAEHYRRLANAFAPVSPLICYSVKSCPNLGIVRLMADRGAGVELVSGGELHRARRAGVAGSKVIFAGIGKTDAEIREALTYAPQSSVGQGIGHFVIETEAELDSIARVARAMGTTCHASVRVNPEVQHRAPALTIDATLASHSFDHDLERAARFINNNGHNNHCRLTGLHTHFGSRMNRVDPCVEAVRGTLSLIDSLSHAARHQIETLHLAGGLGVDVNAAVGPTPADYAEQLLPLLKPYVERGLSIVLEPGRTLASNAGVLVTTVEYIRRVGTIQYIVVDAGMHSMLRPALYDAFHFVWPVRVAPMHVPAARTAHPDMPGLDASDVVGPISESADFLARARKLPPVARGDLMAVFDCGAYGSALASRYTTRPLPPEVLVDGSAATVVREPESIEDTLALELKSRKLDTQRRASFT